MSTPRALVVEDEKSLQILYQSVLQQMGWAVDLAQNGTEAIQLLQENPPDLIFLDVLLPFVNGLAVIEHIKNTPALHDIHVVIASASQQYAGYVDELPSAQFLLKPVLPAQIREILRQHTPQ